MTYIVWINNERKVIFTKEELIAFLRKNYNKSLRVFEEDAFGNVKEIDPSSLIKQSEVNQDSGYEERDQNQNVLNNPFKQKTKINLAKISPENLENVDPEYLKLLRQFQSNFQVAENKKKEKSFLNLFFFVLVFIVFVLVIYILLPWLIELFL